MDKEGNDETNERPKVHKIMKIMFIPQDCANRQEKNSNTQCPFKREIDTRNCKDLVTYFIAIIFCPFIEF